MNLCIIMNNIYSPLQYYCTVPTCVLKLIALISVINLLSYRSLNIAKHNFRLVTGFRFCNHKNFKADPN